MNDISTEAEYWSARYSEEERLAYQRHLQANWATVRPSTVYKPTLLRDGNQWCALFGEDLQSGIAGFGDSPALAMHAFDEEWKKPILSVTMEGSAEAEFFTPDGEPFADDECHACASGHCGWDRCPSDPGDVDGITDRDACPLKKCGDE